jgi:hypothetical protein
LTAGLSSELPTIRRQEVESPHLGINAPRQPTFLRLATRADDSSEDGQRNLFIGGEK